MRVLVACEYSGVVRDAFLARGHDAISCDLLPKESPGPHVQGDVTPLLREPWDLVIAHPPCQYLSIAGAPAYAADPSRERPMLSAIDFYLDCLGANADRIAVENPVMMRRARNIIGRGPDQIIHPWMFGHPWWKRTGLTLRGLMPLLPTRVVDPIGHWTGWKKGERMGHRSAKKRAAFWPGIARAMAEQWG